MYDQIGIDRFPALCIGLGGTGLKTLRCIKWIAEHGGDPVLARMIDEGRLQLFGIDTDDKSRDEAHIEPAVLGLAGDHAQGANKLPELDTFVKIETSTIINAYHEVRTILRQRRPGKNGSAHNEAHKCIAEWFPASETNSDEISMGVSSTNGAGQYRPLGRIGFFVGAQEIDPKLTAAHEKVKGNNRPEHVRVFIVCSLAGGTGAGMFWDAAFLMRRINPSCQIRGMFVLPEPFIGVDTAGRVKANAYAALKEIATYKNWRQDHAFTVNYPSGRRYSAASGGQPAYDSVYLYEAFRPHGQATDPGTAIIDATCMGLAENLLVQLRKDTYRVLDVGANNMSGDVHAYRSQPEGAYAFSTTGAASVTLLEAESLGRSLFACRLDRLKRNLALANRAPVAESALVKALRLADEAAGQPDGGFAAWLASLAKGLPTTPTLVSQWVRETEEARAACEKLRDDQAKAQTRDTAKTIKDLYGRLVPAGVRDGWHQALLGAPQPDAAPLKAAIGTVVDLYGAEITKTLDAVAHALAAEVHGPMTKGFTGLGTEALDLLERFLRAWDEMVAQRPDPGPPLTLTTPPAWHQMRLHLGVEHPADRDGTPSLPFLYKVVGPGPVAAIGERLFASLHDQFGTVLGDDDAPRLAALRVFLASGTHRLRTILDEIRTLHTTTSDHLLRRRRDIDTKRYVVADNEGRVDATVAGATRPMLGMIAGMSDEERAEAARSIHRLLPSVRRELRLADENGADAVIEQFWEEALRQVRLDADRLGPGEAGADPVAQVLAMLDRTCGLREPEDLIDSGRFARYLDGARALGQAFVTAWINRDDFIDQRLGGRAGVIAKLRACQTEVFEGGRVENTIRRTNLVIVRPAIGGAQPQRSRQRVEKLFRDAALAVMPDVPQFTDNASLWPVVYYQDQFRAPREIKNIMSYYESYNRVAKHLRRFYHLHLPAEGLDDLITVVDRPREVYCGNQDCSYNIRDLEETELLCPGCDRPILNRCGNAGCPENSLAARLAALSDSDPPDHCPACGNDLKTYWWHCPEQGHKERIPTDHASCPACETEHHEGLRPLDRVRTFAVRRAVECPGCVELDIAADKRTRIPARLREFFENGVPPHLVATFRHRAAEAGLDPFVCANQQHRHFLFPATVHPDNGRPSHLYRFHTGRFILPNQPQKMFYTCHHCSYPIDVDQYSDTWPCVITCPRCTRDLEHCHFCSDRDHVLFEPTYTPLALDGGLDAASVCERTNGRHHHGDAWGGAKRCPRCTNLMEPVETVRMDLLNSGPNPGFCRNLYGCRAGADPWHTTAEYKSQARGKGTASHQRCKVCRTEPTVLLPFSHLEDHVQACPVCRMIVGLPQHGEVKRDTVADVLMHFASSGVVVHMDGRTCVLCGTQPAHVLRWLCREAEDTTAAPSVRAFFANIPDLTASITAIRAKLNTPDDQLPRLPSRDLIDINDTFNILEAMHGLETEADLFAKISGIALFNDRSRDFRNVVAGFEQLLVKKDHVSYRTVMRRLSGLRTRLEAIRDSENV